MKDDERKLKRWLAGFEKYYADAVPDGPPYRGQEDAPPIWQMWWQGVDKSPALVRICMESVQRRAGGRPVRVMTRENLADYVEIPGFIYDKLASGAMTVTHFSDIARVYLLAEHGGTWVDAATLLTAEVPTEVTGDPFFAYRPTRRNIRAAHCLFVSSFMHAWPGHVIVEGLKRALTNYWRAEETLADYFLFQYMCFGLVFWSPRLTRLWVAECSQESVEGMLALLRMMHRPYNAGQVEGAVRQSFVHYLSRKYKAVPKGSNLAAFLAGDPVFLGLEKPL